MPFQFVKFPGKGRGFSPRASIRRSGQIGLNTGAVIHHGLGAYNSVFLHYDAASQVIGIELVNETGDSSACGLIHRPGNNYIAAKSFFDWFQIPLGAESHRYELEKDAETGLLLIDLKRPVEKRSGRHERDSEE